MLWIVVVLLLPSVSTLAIGLVYARNN